MQGSFDEVDSSPSNPKQLTPAENNTTPSANKQAPANEFQLQEQRATTSAFEAAGIAIKSSIIPSFEYLPSSMSSNCDDRRFETSE